MTRCCVLFPGLLAMMRTIILRSDCKEDDDSNSKKNAAIDPSIDVYMNIPLDDLHISYCEMI